MGLLPRERQRERRCCLFLCKLYYVNTVSPLEPVAKKLKLSLKKKSRFSVPVKEQEMSKVCERYTPANTQKNTAWALRVFSDWVKQRGGVKCPLDLFEKPSADQLNYWLSRFVVEARRSDSEPYPSSSIYQLLAAFLRFARSKCRDCPNFLDKGDSRFRELRGACDIVSRSLREKGV